MFQCVPVASCPVTVHHWQEPGSILFVCSLQVSTFINNIPPESSLPQDKQSQFSQPLLIWEITYFPTHFSDETFHNTTFLFSFFFFSGKTTKKSHMNYLSIAFNSKSQWIISSEWYIATLLQGWARKNISSPEKTTSKQIITFCMFDSPPCLPRFKRELLSRGHIQFIKSMFWILAIKLWGYIFSSEQNYFNSHNQHNQI